MEKKKIENYYIAKYVKKHFQQQGKHYLKIYDYQSEQFMQYLKIYVQVQEYEEQDVM